MKRRGIQTAKTIFQPGWEPHVSWFQSIQQSNCDQKMKILHPIPMKMISAEENENRQCMKWTFQPLCILFPRCQPRSVMCIWPDSRISLFCMTPNSGSLSESQPKHLALIIEMPVLFFDQRYMHKDHSSDKISHLSISMKITNRSSLLKSSPQKKALSF